MRRTPPKSKTLIDENPFGLSLGDLMAGLLLIFVLLLSFVMLRLENLMEEKRHQLEQLDDRERVKKLLINRLLKELSDFDVEVDPDTGVIRIKEGILYDFGKDKLKQVGKEFLRQFIPKYVAVLLSEPDVSEHIAQVIIEGHTDNVGSWELNLDLSLRRANSVAAYLFTEEFGTFRYADALKKLLSANGRSFAQPIVPNDTEGERVRNRKLTLRKWVAKYNDTEEERTQNRRVEFQFRLRDWDLVLPKAEKLLEIETGLSPP
jgi:chemotaxis protein MotB